MVGSMVACRQTWCCKSSWEFYIKISRQQKDRATVSNLSFWNPKATPSDILAPTMPYLLIPLRYRLCQHTQFMLLGIKPRAFQIPSPQWRGFIAVIVLVGLRFCLSFPPSKPELTDETGVASHIAPGFSHLCLLRLKLQVGCHTLLELGGGASGDMNSCLYSKHFNH